MNYYGCWKFLLLALLCSMFSCTHSTDDARYGKGLVKLETYKISNKTVITSYKRNKTGDKVLVTCTGYDSNTFIMLNEQPMETQVINGVLECTIPDELFDKEIEVRLINIARKDRTVASYLAFDSLLIARQFTIKDKGFGGNDGNDIWIVCSGHTPNTKIFLDNKEIEKVFYSDHLVGILPSPYRNAQKITLHLVETRGQYKATVEIFR